MPDWEFSRISGAGTPEAEWEFSLIPQAEAVCVSELPGLRLLRIGKTNRLYLYTEKPITGALLTIVDDAGIYAKDDQDPAKDINGKTCSYDSINGRYYYDVTLHTDTKEGYYRAYWDASYGGNFIELEDKFAPQDIKILKVIATTKEIVSVGYFMETFLKNIDIQSYWREQIRDTISAAKGELENDTEMFFTPTVITDEKWDVYFNPDDFLETFWLHQFHQWPIVSVQDWSCWYSGRKVIDLKPEWWCLDAKRGTIELLPTIGSDSGVVLTMLMTQLSGFAMAGFGIWERIPLFFHIDYTAGLDFDNITKEERDNIRFAIGRRAAINLLPKLDKYMGISGQSLSGDGWSESLNLTASAMYGMFSAQITQYQKDDEKWVQRMRRRYGKNLKMAL